MYLLDASLSLVDTPTGYSSPVGPAVPFTVRYRQRDNQFSSTFNYSNFGPKWTFDWLVSDPAQTVPSGMATTNNYLYYRNTYYWDKQGCAYGDYTKARIYHWLHSADLLSPMGILESTKAPLEGRVWYDYTGQTTSNGSIVVGTTSKPTHTGRVLDDGSTQLYSREYNNFGNITAAIDPAGRTLVNGQVAVPAGGQLKVPTPRVDYLSFRAVPPRARAWRMRYESPAVTTTFAWWSRRSRRLTAVVCSGRNRPQDSKGQWLAMPRARRS